MANKKVLKKEAEEDYTFEYNGVEYTIPHPNRFPLDAIEAMEDQKVASFVKGMLGEKKYKELRKTAKTLEDLIEFMEAAFESIGLDPKE